MDWTPGSFGLKKESPRSEPRYCIWREPPGTPWALSGKQEAITCRNEAHLKMLHPAAAGDTVKPALAPAEDACCEQGEEQEPRVLNHSGSSQ